MLKITQGLNPLAREGVSIYTVGTYNAVRVKTEDEDFCIALHDYIKDGLYHFEWDAAMKIMEDSGWVLFNKNRLDIYYNYREEIAIKLKEMGGEPLADSYYWTSTKYNDYGVWTYDGICNHTFVDNKGFGHRIRPIIVL